jgi:hypothetical protein
MEERLARLDQRIDALVQFLPTFASALIAVMIALLS